jgi:hypothetical protein
MEFEKVTRVEIIDNDGRAFTRYGCSDVNLELQDGGHTMKIFLSSSWRLDREGGVLSGD